MPCDLVMTLLWPVFGLASIWTTSIHFWGGADVAVVFAKGVHWQKLHPIPYFTLLFGFGILFYFPFLLLYVFFLFSFLYIFHSQYIYLHFYLVHFIYFSFFIANT
jgi:hypothetical protein